MGSLKSGPDFISCVSINRPVADQRFLASLYAMMQLGYVARFFPGGKGPVLASPSVASHLPVFEELGQPIVVDNGAELLKEIESS